MDTSDAEIRFDALGVCNHCLTFDMLARPHLQDTVAQQGKLAQIVDRIKRAGAGRSHDCVIGMSGGVDSSYVAVRAVELGLRPLAVHVDGGWNSELAVNNIENIVNQLGVELETVVIAWPEMRDLQLAFFKASVANCDIPQDHAFVASTFRTALSRGIRTILSGVNMATEFVGTNWGHTFGDLRHLRAIHAQHGSIRLKTYPTFNHFQMAIWWPYARRTRQVPILNYMPYVKAEVKRLLMDKFGWRDYGGKHYESVLTKFFQAYYLPVKFGYDKRRIHLSSLILSGQITREDALAELSQPLYVDDQLVPDKEFIAKKLGVSAVELERILALPVRSHDAYPTNTKMVKQVQAVLGRARRWSASFRGKGS